jgi:hypothetical protein
LFATHLVQTTPAIPHRALHAHAHTRPVHVVTDTRTRTAGGIHTRPRNSPTFPINAGGEDGEDHGALLSFSATGFFVDLSPSFPSFSSSPSYCGSRPARALPRSVHHRRHRISPRSGASRAAVLRARRTIPASPFCKWQFLSRPLPSLCPKRRPSQRWFGASPLLSCVLVCVSTRAGPTNRSNARFSSISSFLPPLSNSARATPGSNERA